MKKSTFEDNSKNSPLSKEDITGGFGAAGLAAIGALAYFAKEMGMNTDILKLPQQLKSMRAMSTFAKGIGTIGMVINFIVSLIVSRLTKPTPNNIKDLVESIRYPK